MGLLDNINAEDATVALKSVRSFGTEGRMISSGNPQFEVPPGNDIYDYVVFRGSDVKDLAVLDVPVEQVKPEPFNPPAAAAPSGPGNYPSYGDQKMATRQSNIPQYQTQAPRPTGTLPFENAGQPAPTTTATTSQMESRPQNAPRAPSMGQAANNGARSEVPAPQEGSRPQKREAKDKNLAENEFDFVSANEKFNKEIEAERELHRPSYDKKSSFFDNISLSTDEHGMMKWSEEKTLNIDTFGEDSVNDASRSRGRGRGRGRGFSRGRGRGGRGRGRGRGRGYYRGGRNDNENGTNETF